MIEREAPRGSGILPRSVQEIWRDEFGVTIPERLKRKRELRAVPCNFVVPIRL